MTRTPKQVAAMQQVIDWLAGGAVHVDPATGVILDSFDYSNWISNNECGTSACIAGAAVQFAKMPNTVFVDNYDDSHETAAAELLGLDEEETQLLFYPFDLLSYALEDMDVYFENLEEEDLDEYGDTYPLKWVADLSPQQIAAVLQVFNDTGVIDWYLVS